jgi:hypothetical protein
MIFPIELKTGSRIFQTIEKFTLWPKDNPYKTVVLQNNRPLIRKKLKLKTKPYSWKVVSGNIKDQRALDETIARIEKYIDENLTYRNT